MNFEIPEKENANDVEIIRFYYTIDLHILTVGLDESTINKITFPRGDKIFISRFRESDRGPQSFDLQMGGGQFLLDVPVDSLEVVG